MITRRNIIVALTAVSLCHSLRCLAQPARTIPVIGVLSLDASEQIEWLKEGLRNAGYEEGRNIRLEIGKSGDRFSKYEEILNEFIRLKVDAIVTLGSTATIAASKATSTIPIVMVAGIDPVKEQLAATLSRPGRNVTGVVSIFSELAPKRLELAKEALPSLRRVGLLWNPDSRASTVSLAATEKTAKALNLELQIIEIRSAADIDSGMQALVKSQTKLFISLQSSMFAVNKKKIIESAYKHKLAGVYFAAEWVEAGGLMSYGLNRPELYGRAATYLHKILMGAKPGYLPIEQPTKFELAVNLKTAKALGINIPPSILVQATKVIE